MSLLQDRLFWLLGCLLFAVALSAQVSVTFIVRDLPTEAAGQLVGIRGDLPPLSWEVTTNLSKQEDGSYSAKVDLTNVQPGQLIAYKFVYTNARGETIYELSEEGNRIFVVADPDSQVVDCQWDRQKDPDVTNLPNIPAEQLQRDLPIIQAALQLHPGRYRYHTEASLQQHMARLEADFSSDLTYGEAYLALSRFLASIRCGHTMANIYNQNKVYQTLLLEQPNKLPLAFDLLDRRMIIRRQVSGEGILDSPAEILAINGHPVEAILDTLLQYVESDGHEPAPRLYRLQLTAQGQYESFDLFFPLLFPPRNGRYELDVYLPEQESRTSISVPALSLTERTQRMQEKYPSLPSSYDDLWRFELIDNSTAYLQLGTFVTYKMELDWKGFLADAFQEMRERKTAHLILDIRGNAGGMDQVLAELQKYLLSAPIEVMPYESRTAYQRVPDMLRPYCHTWDNRIFDLSARTTDLGNGFYRYGKPPRPRTLKRGKRPFDGKVYLLTDAGNSSATFLLARYARQGGFAQLVGQTTGGNLNGINGGNMFFVKLPHSGLEFDIPVFGSFPATPQPDRGIEPDIEVRQTVADAFTGKDTVLEYVLNMIQQHK